MRSHDLARQLLDREDMEFAVLDSVLGEEIEHDDYLVWPDSEDGDGRPGAVMIPVEIKG